MSGIQCLLWTRLGAALLGITALPTPAHAQNDLKTISNPGGGQIIYGPVTGQSSLHGALITMLRNAHSRFGERPQIGKLYHARGTQSVATFFSVTAKDPPGKPIRGMVIVAMPTPNLPVGAIMYDDAGRFGTTWSAMMKKLNETWPQDNPQSSQSAGRSAATHAAAPLRRTPFADGSGSIGLPEGWHITGAGGGSVRAAGPNGESIALAVIWQMYDPTNQQGRGLINYLTLNGRSLPAGSAIYPCCDLVGAWLAAGQPRDRSQPAITFRRISSGRIPHGAGEYDAVTAKGELDYHDGKGPLLTSLRLSLLAPPGSGTYGLFVMRLSVPDRLADQEWPTMMAIAASQNQNARVIGDQVNAWIRDNNARAEAGRRIVAERGAQNDARNRQIEKDWDDKKKGYQAFSNYTLDKTVIRDTETGAHGTFDYADADFLIRNFPDRFETVPTPEFIKPVDYWD
jgi:hypothetical protein